MSFDSAELMTVVAARQLQNDQSVLVGVGRPSHAAILAKRTHAPDLVLIYESGTIDADPDSIPLSIGDPELAATSTSVVSLPDIFNYWLQPGRIDVGFLGAAQIDRHGNLNTTVIGEYDHPRVRLPGAGGAPEIARSCQEIVVTLPHSARTFVPELDFTTSLCRSDGEGSMVVVTDLGVLETSDQHDELELTATFPGIGVGEVQDQTGWELKVAGDVAEVAPPTAEELEVLRSLGSKPKAVR
ncbi:MAG: CoA-transferase subunit beta [Solirubrobacterales bacterium]|nr:CoA-transferase subunit beta [Solirubrobacterales bacterium]